MEHQPSKDMTRRDVLRKGARLGTVAWVAPAITVLAVDQAAAATASGGGPGRISPPNERAGTRSSNPWWR
jgi:hypothetical protein